MKAFNRAVDRFCVRHPRFGISNLMLYVIIGNAIVFLFSVMDTTGLLLYYLCFDPAMILRGQVWRLLTFALIPDSSGLWTLLFLYFYYFIGNTLEREWGTVKFNLYFFSGILLTVLYGMLVYLVFHINVTLAASYIYLSMFFSFAAFYPDQRVLFFFFIPVKIKWLAYLDAAYFVMEIAMLPGALKLLPVIAVLNFLLFCGEELLAPFLHSSFYQRKKTVNFRREVNRINAERRAAPYRFRCEVCGRTDVSDPSLEFRYCSRCSGYHCFCIDHINAHTHHTV